MDDGWACGWCDAHNESGTTACRLCQRKPGTVNGTARDLPAPSVLSKPVREQPVFGQSKHTIALTPVTREPAPRRVDPAPRPSAPRPPARPPYSSYSSYSPTTRRRTNTGQIARRLVITLVLIVGGLVLVGNLPRLLATIGSAAQSGSADQSATACPYTAAEWLPDGGSDSVLVSSYSSDRFLITICRADSGQLYYDGQVADAAVNDTTHISIPAEQTSNGFIAHNAGYTYQIEGTTETVLDESTLKERFTLTQTGP